MNQKIKYACIYALLAANFAGYSTSAPKNPKEVTDYVSGQSKFSTPVVGGAMAVAAAVVATLVYNKYGKGAATEVDGDQTKVSSGTQPTTTTTRVASEHFKFNVDKKAEKFSQGFMKAATAQNEEAVKVVASMTNKTEKGPADVDKYGRQVAKNAVSEAFVAVMKPHNTFCDAVAVEEKAKQAYTTAEKQFKVTGFTEFTNVKKTFDEAVAFTTQEGKKVVSDETSEAKEKRTKTAENRAAEMAYNAVVTGNATTTDTVANFVDVYVKAVAAAETADKRAVDDDYTQEQKTKDVEAAKTAKDNAENAVGHAVYVQMKSNEQTKANSDKNAATIKVVDATHTQAVKDAAVKEATTKADAATANYEAATKAQKHAKDVRDAVAETARTRAERKVFVDAYNAAVDVRQEFEANFPKNGKDDDCCGRDHCKK